MIQTTVKIELYVLEKLICAKLLNFTWDFVGVTEDLLLVLYALRISIHCLYFVYISSGN